LKANPGAGVSSPRVNRAVADAASLCLRFKTRKSGSAEKSEKSSELLKFDLPHWERDRRRIYPRKLFSSNDFRKQFLRQL